MRRPPKRTCTSLVTTWIEPSVTARYLIQPLAATAAVVANAGSGYAVNDTITLTGGTFNTATVLTVTALVPTTSTIATVSITTPGRYSVAPTSPVAQGSSSGPGVNATFTMTYAKQWQTTTTAPALLEDAFRMTEPGTHKTYGLYMRNTWTRTAGSGAWSNISPSTKSIISAAAAPDPDLLTWPTATNLGANAGGVVIISGNTAHASNTTPLNIATIGKLTIASGEVFGGYIGFAHALYTQDFSPLRDLACWFALEPNAAAATGQTFTCTTDIWECYG